MVSYADQVLEHEGLVALPPAAMAIDDPVRNHSSLQSAACSDKSGGVRKRIVCVCVCVCVCV